jgi:hypothetical protein
MKISPKVEGFTHCSMKCGLTLTPAAWKNAVIGKTHPPFLASV